MYTLNEIIEQNKDWIDDTWEKIDKKLSRLAVKERDKIPYTTVNGVHNDNAKEDITHWGNGFWGGMMWLMYKGTGNEEYRKTAERSEEMMDVALRDYRSLHHDVGFMWHILSGANYKLTGNEDSFTRNIYAATVLASRYDCEGDYIIAWNWGAQGYSIIDTLMNLPLLYWASDVIGDERFDKLAVRHMNMALRDHIRPDGSVNHIVDHDRKKPGVKRVLAGQGYRADSCWSRGLSWAIYGSVISYIHVGKPEYLEAATRTADYFIEHCKETGYKPVIDFGAPVEPVYYDSSAAMIAACGMLEIAKCLPKEKGAKYAEAAVRILKACDESFCNYEEDEDALVLMSSGSYPQNEEAIAKSVHRNYMFGDFYFVEAMLKLRGDDFFIW